MEQEEHAGVPAPIGIEALQLQAQDEIETRQVLTRFGYEGTLEQVIGETRMRMRRSTEDLVEIGRAVLAFRELPRGGYGPAVKAIGLSEGTALRLANVALKFLGHDHRRPLLTLDRSKVYELALLDETELDALAADPAKLDQVERMSVSELKRELRAAKQGLEDKDGLIRRVQDENAALREREIARDRCPPDEESRRRAERMNANHEAAQRALVAVSDFILSITRTRELCDTAEKEHADGTACWLAQQISQLYLNHGIAVDFAEIVTPSWSTSAAKDA